MQYLWYALLALAAYTLVAPIFGLFFVGSSVAGIAVLDEPLTVRKAAGIALAIVAVFLTTFEG